MIGREEGAPRFVRQARDVEASGDATSALFLSRSKLLSEAYEFAADAHAGQRQESDGSPYVEHPVAVARILQRAGFGDDVVAAGLLHDTVEDSEVEIDDLDERFGRSVAKLVSAMTEPERLRDFSARKEAHRMQISDAGCEAAAIFAADKIVNVQSLRWAVAQQGEERVRGRLSSPLEQKVEHYRKTLEMLDDLALPLSLTPLLRAELESLDADLSSDRGRHASRRRLDGYEDTSLPALG